VLVVVVVLGPPWGKPIEYDDEDEHDKEAAGFFLIVLVVVVVLGPPWGKPIEYDDDDIAAERTWMMVLPIEAIDQPT
jgi:hypothetical protein